MEMASSFRTPLIIHAIISVLWEGNLKSKDYYQLGLVELSSWLDLGKGRSNWRYISFQPPVSRVRILYWLLFFPRTWVSTGWLSPVSISSLGVPVADSPSPFTPSYFWSTMLPLGSFRKPNQFPLTLPFTQPQSPLSECGICFMPQNWWIHRSTWHGS